MKSIVASAKTNRVTHAAISQAIRSLERQVGFPLLAHAKRRFELTRQGRELYRNADEAIESLERMLASVKKGSEAVHGPLTVGFSHSIGTRIISPHLGSFCRKHPQVLPSVRVGNSASLERLIATREVDLGFGVEDESFSRCERSEIFCGKFVVAGSKTARRETIKRYLVGDKGNDVATLRSTLRDRGTKAEFIEVQSWEIIFSLAQAGVGLGLLPDYFVRLSKPSGLSPLAGFELPKYRLCAFFRSRQTLSPAAEALLSWVCAELVRSRC